MNLLDESVQRVVVEGARSLTVDALFLWPSGRMGSPGSPSMGLMEGWWKRDVQVEGTEKGSMVGSPVKRGCAKKP